MKKILTAVLLSTILFGTLANAEDKTMPSEQSSNSKNATNQATAKEKMAPQAKSAMQNDSVKKIGNYQAKGTGSRAMAHFKKMDSNNDGNVSKEEFVAFSSMKFNQKDKNKDGNLSPAECSPTLAKKMAGQKS